MCKGPGQREDVKEAEAGARSPERPARRFLSHSRPFLLTFSLAASNKNFANNISVNT